MPYYRVKRLGCGGLLIRSAFVALVGIVALICIANRSWFEAKAVNALYGDRRAIHLGKEFRPGATAFEDGVRQTAVLVDHDPHIRVESPTATWLRHHRDAVCKHDVCTAAATPLKNFVGVGIGMSAVLAMLVVLFAGWTLLSDDRGDRYGGYGGYGDRRYMR
ncbi:hypothetical protein [Actinoallomurus sp. CA-150999]|uniref:hypothetical protein n=1 Tax=Actinoallomurus sp. CA-150999 TaxID=3239887 RepID=UPI003D90AD15